MTRKADRKEIRKQHNFIALRGKQIRTFVILAADEEEAIKKAKRKYPGWDVGPYVSSSE